MMKKLVLLVLTVITALLFTACSNIEYVHGGINDKGIYENPTAGFTYEFPTGSHLMDSYDLDSMSSDTVMCDFGFTTAYGSEVILKVEEMPVAAFPTDMYADSYVDTIKESAELSYEETIVEDVKALDRVTYGGVVFDRLEFTVTEVDINYKTHYIILLKSVGNKMIFFGFEGTDKTDFEDVVQGFAEYKE